MNKLFKNKKVLLGILFLSILIFLVYYFVFSKKALNEEKIDTSKIETIDESKLDRIKEGVTLKNLDFENLNREKAKKKIEEKQEELLEGKINFKFGDINDVRTNPRTLTYKVDKPCDIPAPLISKKSSRYSSMPTLNLESLFLYTSSFKSFSVIKYLSKLKRP